MTRRKWTQATRWSTASAVSLVRRSSVRHLRFTDFMKSSQTCAVITRPHISTVTGLPRDRMMERISSLISKIRNLCTLCCTCSSNDMSFLGVLWAAWTRLIRLTVLPQVSKSFFLVQKRKNPLTPTSSGDNTQSNVKWGRIRIATLNQLRKEVGWWRKYGAKCDPWRQNSKWRAVSVSYKTPGLFLFLSWCLFVCKCIVFITYVHVQIVGIGGIQDKVGMEKNYRGDVRRGQWLRRSIEHVWHMEGQSLTCQEKTGRVGNEGDTINYWFHRHRHRLTDTDWPLVVIELDIITLCSFIQVLIT